MIESAMQKSHAVSTSLLALALMLGVGRAGWSRSRDLTESEARELVIGALDPSARGLPKLSIDPYVSAKTPIPDFYEFGVTWDNTSGSVIVGFFAVSRATGDVWKLVVCRRVESPKLKHLQRAIRKRISMGRKEFVGLTDKAPCDP